MKLNFIEFINILAQPKKQNKCMNITGFLFSMFENEKKETKMDFLTKILN